MKHLQQKYLEYQKNNLIRDRIAYTSANNIDFTSSDYLNIANSTNLKKTIVNGFDKYGLGSKGSSTVCGYTEATQEFEDRFAKFTNYSKAIFFNSGFMANLAIYSTLFNKDHTIFADKNIHASTLDGIKLSGAKLKRYPHQNTSHLQKIYDNKSFVTTEGIFSTTGNISDLNKMSAISRNLILDEAHSLGVMGKSGRGSKDHHNLNESSVPISIYPLGKAFGSVGAIVCASSEICNYLIQFAREYIYTTAIPPMIVEANILQLENLINANQQREILKHNINHFDKCCNHYDLKTTNINNSPIKSIIIPNLDKAIRIKKQLSNDNISVSCFRYPTVPKNSSMLRFSIHSNNTKHEIEKTLDIVRSLI